VPECHRRAAFFGTAALLFAASAAATIVWCLSMAGTGDVPMPGGWTLSGLWTPLCGQGWADAAACFIGMWTVMMAAMMLPSLAPMLWRYSQALGRGGQAHVGRLTALAAGGYFLAWILLGALVFVVCAAVAELAMRVPAIARAVPLAMAVVIVLAGAFQFTSCKARHLACCRPASRHALPLRANAGTAWCHGVALGFQCVQACAGLTAILLVIGVMDLRAMAVVTAIITAERLAPAGERIAWAAGAVSVATGVYLMGRAAWLL
jgi:predicted metal-binding membrane protein